MSGKIVFGLSVSCKTSSLADAGAGELGTEAVGVLGKLDENVRIKVDTGSSTSGKLKMAERRLAKIVAKNWGAESNLGVLTGSCKS